MHGHQCYPGTIIGVVTSHAHARVGGYVIGFVSIMYVYMYM